MGGGASGAKGFIATGTYQPKEIFKNGGHTDYDPHDIPEIVTAIKFGINNVTLKDKRTWLGEQGPIKQIALKTLKLI